MVILVMKQINHVLGWMKGMNPEIKGVTNKEWNVVSTYPNSGRVFFNSDAEYVDPNLGHSFEEIESRCVRMKGFFQQVANINNNMSELVMKGFRAEAIPVYLALASEFAIFDRWFSSLPSPTEPNMLFLYSTTSHGATSHVPKQLIKGYSQNAIFQSLHESGLSSGIYYHTIPTTLFYRELRKLKYISRFH
ncbi:hypothetical protein KI387_033886, partial [Taxus chinensis]